ncbi:hypothetical protein AB0M47_08280 [Hamadaea sp. NPDC051192]|uniref:hypothetical protein n=1 Tax=Hamadaea sp. NPDC051192 TaxID=3154940 RepID=UPI003414B763
MTTPIHPQNPPAAYPTPGQQPPPQYVQYTLGTAKLSKKFGTLGTVVWIILGVVLVIGGVVSVAIHSIVPIGLAGAAAVMVLLRRFLRPGRTGVIGKQAMGTMTIGVQGIAIANVQGRANSFAWNEIDAVGVLRWKQNIVFRSGSARVAQLLPPMRPGVPVYLPISLIYVEAPDDEVINALRYFGGQRFVGVDLANNALDGYRG